MSILSQTACDGREAADGNLLFESIQPEPSASAAGSSRGVAWADYDEDGLPELYVSNTTGQENVLYRNGADGSFAEVAIAGTDGGDSEGVNWIDYDDDGDLDLFVANRGPQPNFLLRNDGPAGFTSILDHALTAPGQSTTMACWADADGDGDVDVFLAAYRENQSNSVFQNVGNGEFLEVPDTALASGRGEARACGWADVEGDGLPELFVANALIPNRLFRNRGNWQFEPDETPHLVSHEAYSYGTSWADFDDDGDLDLFVANFDRENVLYVNDGAGRLEPMTGDNLVEETSGASKGHAWGDFDNDGDLDLYIANGTYGPDMRNFLYLNRGDGSFHRVMDEPVLAHADTSAGVAAADYDRDGDLDLFVANWGDSNPPNRLYLNMTVGRNWITLRLRSQGKNRFAIGAHVRVVLPGGQALHRWVLPSTGYASQNDYELHFGLGDHPRIDTLEIRWPTGGVDAQTNVESNQHLLVSG